MSSFRRGLEMEILSWIAEGECGLGKPFNQHYLEELWSINEKVLDNKHMSFCLGQCKQWKRKRSTGIEEP